jgi:hypothetical protein
MEAGVLFGGRNVQCGAELHLDLDQGVTGFDGVYPLPCAEQPQWRQLIWIKA